MVSIKLVNDIYHLVPLKTNKGEYMKIISNVINWIQKNYKIIAILIQLAKALEEKLDPKEKYQIDDKALDILDKLLKQMKK